MTDKRKHQVVRSLGGQRPSVKKLAALNAVKPTATTPSPSKVKSVASNQKKTLPKLYVVDTNVFMHDPTSLFHFQEHDIAILSVVLEELDNNKKGKDDPNRNARQTSRLLDEIFSSCDMSKINTGISLIEASKGEATGNVFVYICDEINGRKADNIIISAAQALSEEFKGKKYSDVVIVSKDINMRIKARSLGVEAADYLTDKTIEDSDVLPSGTLSAPPNFLSAIYNVHSWKKDDRVYYKTPSRFKLSKMEVKPNEFITDGTNHFQIISVDEGGIVLRVPIDYSKTKNFVYGIGARNSEQNYALNLLMDPNVDFVELMGQAGTGKTLLTLAAALQQTMEQKRFSEIIYTRITVPVGEDIGFLPGTEEEKMTPWAGALQDNLDVLITPTDDNNKKDGVHQSAEWGRAATMDLIRSRVKVKSLSFMRGRTFINKFLIIDESQNLTPKQMKTLITRAGPGTKVVCLGNIGQIDTPYLSEGSSGLTYVVERFRGWAHCGHITLQKGERSRLADYANEVL